MMRDLNTSFKNVKESTQKLYFEPLSNDVDYPLEISEERMDRAKYLEGIFNNIYDEHSLSIAKVSSDLILIKQASKDERDATKVLDRSFTYGEIVSIFIINRLLMGLLILLSLLKKFFLMN